MKKNILYIGLLFMSLALVSASPGATTLFSDDFDDNVILDDGWAAAHFEHRDNGSPPQDVHAIQAPKAYSGTSAGLEDDVAIYHKVDARSHVDVTLSYCRRTDDVTSGDRLRVGWKKAPLGTINASEDYWSTNWNEVESVNEPNWSCVNKFLGSGADDSEIYVAFFLDNGEDDFGYVDDVKVSATQLDTRPPVISDITQVPQHPVCTSDVRVCAEITDDSKLDTVRLNYRSINGQGSWNMHHTTGNTYCGDISPSSVSAADTLMITYDIYAKDVKGNDVTSDSSKYTYDCKNPVAQVGGPYSCDEGSMQVLNASESFDTVDEDLHFAWDYDDNGDYDDAFGATPTYECMDDGIYLLSVRVTDDANHSSVADTRVNVSNVNPVAEAGGPYSGDEGTDVELTASATDVGKKDTHTYAWDLDGDNTFETPGIIAHYACIDEGTFDVAVQVTDDDKGVDVDTAQIVCKNVAPVVTASKDQTVTENEEFKVEFAFTDKGVKDVHNGMIVWTPNDTLEFPFNTTSPLVGHHRYCTEGVYVVKGLVEDNAWGMGSANTTITVTNVPPIFDNLDATTFTAVKETFTYDVDARDVGCDTLVYSLVTAPTGMSINSETGEITWTPTYGQEGDHEVTVRVNDGAADVDATLHIHVYNYKLELEKGLNLISIPLVPLHDNVSINNVFGEEVSSKAEILWSYTYDSKKDKNVWKYNEPLKSGKRWSAARSRVQEIVPGYGYYILMENGTEVYHDGKKMYGNGQFAFPPQVALTTGWNLIGHYGTNIVKKSDEVQDLSGGILTDLADLNVVGGNSVSVNVLNPGEGYWTFVTGQDNLLYAPSAKDYEKPNNNNN